ncbi:hypothetical protein AURDEDRAFT_184388 [Auricularia subglabra TFB-10046 SS5]|nr:hypothetical protein AURDEDRAFT_184388 [Auricularia subglabra TFB-10046 SS5]
MTIVNRTCRLPVELMSMVVDYVDVATLVPLCAVCVKWRAVACSHPLFWRDIQLAALSTSALSFFHARLDQARGRDIRLDICLSDSPPSWRIKSIILPAITRHLPQVVRLSLKFHSGVATDVLSAMNLPAPRLTGLTIDFNHCSDKEPAVLLPSDLFAQSSPKLTCVLLSNVTLPLRRILAFQHAKSLFFDFKYPRIFQRGIFQHFPALTSLAVFGDSYIGIEDDTGYEEAPEGPRLSGLEVRVPEWTYDGIFDLVPYLRAIPNVRCWQPHIEIARTLLGALHGPLEMVFESTPNGRVYITLRAPDCGRVRTFIEFASHILEDWPHEALFDPALAERVTVLGLSTSLAHLASHFPEMPACRTLEIYLSAGEMPSSFAADMALLRLPALAALAVKSTASYGEMGRALGDDQLSAYLAALAKHTAKRPELRLERLPLIDSSDIVSHAFELI